MKEHCLIVERNGKDAVGDAISLTSSSRCVRYRVQLHTSKLIAAAVSIATLALPATAMAGGSPGNAGSGGSGQAQIAGQAAATLQAALSAAHAQQNAVNGNSPVGIAGGALSGGSNSANQGATNGATSSAGKP